MKQILGTYCLLLVSLWVLVVGVFPHHHHNEAFCVSPDMETCASSSHDGCEGRHHCAGDADKHACDISCVTHLSFSVPHHLPDFTPDYTFYTLIYLSSLCLEAPSVSFERGDMISYYVEKLHARHFSAVRNFRAPPFAVVACFLGTLLHFATCLQRVGFIFANKKQQYSMKNYILTGTLCMFLLGGCGEHAHDHEHEGHDHEAEIHAEEKTAHSDEIVLTPEKAKAAGVEAEVVHPGAFREVIQAGGQILSAQGQEETVVAASSGVVSFSRKIAEGIEVGKGSELLSVSAEHIQEGDPVRKAKVAYEKAKEEYERAEKLVGSQIVSQKEFAALREAYQNARLAYEALLPSKSGKGVAVKAPIGGFVKNCLVKEGDYVTIGQPLMTVTQMRRLVLKADVSERYYAQLPRIVSANFKTPYNNKVYSLENLGGKVLSFGKSSGDTSYYVPVTFEFDNRGDMVPGAFVEVFLLSGERQGVISLPESALTEEQGLYFVYLKLDDECYKKQEVQLGTSNGERVEILSGLKDGDTVVTRGAIHVKLAAASNAIPAHSHNH